MYVISVCIVLVVFWEFFFSSRRRHTRCALVTVVQTCALPIYRRMVDRNAAFRQHFLKVAIADRIATIPAHRPQDHITLEMAQLEIRHRSVRPISAKHAQASRFLQQSLYAFDGNPIVSLMAEESIRALARSLPLIKADPTDAKARGDALYGCRSEEHTSELQSLMRISSAVLCLNKKKTAISNQPT